jgi:hypothetical protein
MNLQADLANSPGKDQQPQLKRPRTPPGARGFAFATERTDLIEPAPLPVRGLLPALAFLLAAVAVVSRQSAFPLCRGRN